ncbi:MAG: M42 family peptidase [Candidatus Latescibacterota bacterium]|nr:M42 family peptidase [Candidatus Latescibacterota bacterium]
MRIDTERLYTTLEKLLSAHAPSGAEAEMDVLVNEFAATISDAVWQDAADNIIIHIKGESDERPVAALSHKDEIALIVKRVDPDGKIRVRPLGGLHPWALGESPVELMGRDGLCPGVLSIGAKHVSEESPAGPLKTGQPLTWDQMWIETRVTAEELAQRGIRAGTRAVIARKHKMLWRLGDSICGYNLDCRAGLAAILEAGMYLRENRPAQDVYLVASGSEEIGGHGATYALAQLPVETAVAVDIAPAAAEYGTINSGDPIVGVRDSRGLYDERIIGRFDQLATKHGFAIQTAVLTSYSSDSTIAKTSGSVGRAALIGYPGDNTHGYEICSWDGIVNTAQLLLAYLEDPAI